MIKFLTVLNITLAAGLLIFLLATAKEVKAAVYCYPHVGSTVCFSDQDGRSFGSGDEHVRNPNVVVTPGYHPMMPAWMYYQQVQPNHRPPSRITPEQDFGECTLALGCLKRK